MQLFLQIIMDLTYQAVFYESVGIREAWFLGAGIRLC